MITSEILKPTQPTQEDQKQIIEAIILDAINKLKSIPNIYEYKPIQKADIKQGKLYYYFTNENQINKQIEILNNLLEDLKTSQDLEKTLKSYFNLKIGNIKLDDIIFNFSSSHLCKSFLCGYCQNCTICYGFKYEYSKSTLLSRLKNYIFIEYVIKSGHYELLKQVIQETNLNKLIKDYNNQIKTALRKENKKENPNPIKIKELESKIISDPRKIRNIRINEIGELENKHYKFLKILLTEINNNLVITSLKFKYTYTHNKELDITKFKELVNINKSLNFSECIQYLETIKHELTHNIYCNCKNQTEAQELEQYLKQHNIKYCYCKADCTKCSYCKTNIKRVIITYNH